MPFAYKTGKLPKKVDHLNRTLQFGNYVDRGSVRLPSPAERGSWIAGAPADWGMLGNDAVGLCTLAAFVHQVQVWVLVTTGRWVTVPTPDMIAAYSALTGYDPQALTDAAGNNPTDTGASCLDALKFCRTAGVGGHRLGAFAEVDARDPRLVEIAVSLFGGVYVGANLPATAGAQYDAGRGWTVADPALAGDSAPASLGGHAFNAPAFGPQGLRAVTWGLCLPVMDWAFWADYVDEAYVLFSQEWVRGDGFAPSGVDRAALLLDLDLVTREG